MTEFAVKEGDIAEVPSDLLLLKYAQAFYGADAAVASRLISAHLCTDAELQPAPGDFVVIEAQGLSLPSGCCFWELPLCVASRTMRSVFAGRRLRKLWT